MILLILQLHVLPLLLPLPILLLFLLVRIILTKFCFLFLQKHGTTSKLLRPAKLDAEVRIHNYIPPPTQRGDNSSYICLNFVNI